MTHPEVLKFLSECGKKGGSSTSLKKIKSSRINGKKGGRPRKVKNV